MLIFSNLYNYHKSILQALFLLESCSKTFTNRSKYDMTSYQSE